jgi:DNA-directed RNA polymerase specialized sigma24 family protein
MGELTQEQLDGLLAWLDPDRNMAALRYEKIRLRLIRILACRGCWEAESLADDIIDRVSTKVEWLRQNYVGDPALYFYGVAQNVFKEYLRKKPRESQSSMAIEPGNSEQDERLYDCLTSCMDRLPEENANLVIKYYDGERQSKISNRKRLADELGITLDALRIRCHRIRRELRKCVLQCLGQTAN